MLKTASNSCVLCGETKSILKTFYLRTKSSTGTRSIKTRWIDNHAKCCSECFEKVSSLQKIKSVMSVITYAPMFLIGHFVYFEVDIPGSVFAFPFITMAIGLTGLITIGIKRRRLINTPHLNPLIELLESVHGIHGSMKASRIVIVPLATVGDSIFEEER